MAGRLLMPGNGLLGVNLRLYFVDLMVESYGDLEGLYFIFHRLVNNMSEVSHELCE